MAVAIRNNSVASFCEECVLWRVFGFHLTAYHINLLALCIYIITSIVTQDVSGCVIVR